jgi:electron transfer flavoprotein alpha subunit
MAVLVLADHTNSALGSATAKALTAAKAMGGDVHILIAGHECGGAASAAAQLAGVAKVLVADAVPYAHGLAEDVAALIVSLMPSYDAVVSAGTTSGKNVMPRVAALLDVMQVSDIIAVKSADTFDRPIYAGNAIQTVQAHRRQEGHYGSYRGFCCDRHGWLSPH